MKCKFIIKSILLLLVVFSSCTPETHVKKGDQFFTIGEYFDAAAEYKKAYSRTQPKDKEKRGERAWKMAQCYRRINYTAKAIGGYQNAIRYGYPDSMAYFYLGKLQQKNGDYKSATKSYTAFLGFVPNDTLALNGLKGCELAQKWKNEFSLYSIKKEPILTSRRSDFCPALLGDESDMLYFSSTRNDSKGKEISGITGTKSADIFFTKKDDKGKWEPVEAVEGELNSEYEEGACYFSPDGKTMYLTRCTFDSDFPRFAEICTSTRSDASWSKPQLLQISKDTLSSYAHPAVSPDGLWLYFTSDMPGGQGGFDIWRIALTDHGLGGVENVGYPINTPGDEMFPAFRPNGDFYFSSDGHVGMGGLDIIKATQDSLGVWTLENLKYPMNSCGDDFGMTFEGLLNKGYFSTNRGDARGWDHIMSFEHPEVIQSVKGWVYEKDGYELPEGLVYMVGDDGTYLKLSVRGDGSFEQEVKPNVNYIFLGTCKGYLNHTEQLSVDTSSVSKEYTLQFPLASIENPVLIRNIFYEFDSAALLDSSCVALDSLVVLLNENPNVTIELAAHCDFRGKDEYNERLSQRRAESVVNYLIAHGIDTLRLTPVGYGEKRPKVVTRKIASTYDFLNEGDTLTEAFILALDTEEKQEICHSLNRRTEFKVLRTTYKLFDTPVTPAEPVKEEIEDSLKQESLDDKIDPKLLDAANKRDNRELKGGKEMSEEDKMRDEERKKEEEKGREDEKLKDMKPEEREKYEEKMRNGEERQKAIETLKSSTTKRLPTPGGATKKDESQAGKDDKEKK